MRNLNDKNVNIVRPVGLVSGPANVVVLKDRERQSHDVRRTHTNLYRFLLTALTSLFVLLLAVAVSLCFAFCHFQSRLFINRSNSSSTPWSLLVPGNLAELYIMYGQYDRAIHVYEDEIIPTIVQANGSTSLELAQVRSTLGDIYQQAGNQSAYETQYQMALSILSKLKDGASESHNNAEQLLEQENIEKTVIGLRTRLLGANSLQVAEDKLSLILFYLKNDQWQKGKFLFEQIKQVCHQSKNLSVPSVLIQLGERYQDSHDAPQAEYLFSEAADLCQKLGEKCSYSLVIALFDLGCMQVERGSYNQALETLNRARKALPDDNLKSSKKLLAAICEEQGWCHLGLNDIAKGEQCFQNVLVLGNDIGRSDPNMGRGFYGLGWIYHHQGNYDKAEQKYKEALSVIGKSAIGSLRTKVVAALTEVYRERGKLKEAAALESQSTLVLQPVLTDLLLSEGKSSKYPKNFVKWQAGTR